jgi:hypothetical protein
MLPFLVCKKENSDLFPFFAVNFKFLHTRNKKKKFEKKKFRGGRARSASLRRRCSRLTALFNSALQVKKTYFNFFFSNRHFFIAVFVGSKQFLPNFKPYSNRPLCTKACCKKSGGVNGKFFRVIQP